MDEELRSELLRMADEDRNKREELLHSGNLPKWSYSPVIKEIHKRNNARIREILARFGWPRWSLVGEDGCEAAWLIVQHAVLDPDLQRDCLPLLEEAVASKEAPLWQLAYLKDRLLKLDGKEQIYGTQYTEGPDGKSIPWKIADEDNVDERRREAGLPLLKENTKRILEEDELLNEEL